MTLEGSLQDMALIDLIRVFSMDAKSGILLLRKKDDQGIIYVAHGVLIDAVITRLSDDITVATADEAVLQLLTWETASFTFCYDPSVYTHPRCLSRTGLDLVVEALRKHPDPNRVLPYYSLTLDTTFQLAPLSGSIYGIQLDLQQWQVLSQIANQGHLRDIDIITEMEVETAFRIAIELLSIGLIEIAPPSTLPLYQVQTDHTTAQLVG